MSGQLYALPGFMPPSNPKQDLRQIISWGSPIDILLLSEPAYLPEKPVVWHMEIQGYGQKLILQRTGESIYSVISGESREYRLRLPGKSLPAGTHLLEFSVGGYDGVGSAVGRLSITIERTLGSTASDNIGLPISGSTTD